MAYKLTYKNHLQPLIRLKIHCVSRRFTLYQMRHRQTTGFVIINLNFCKANKQHAYLLVLNLYYKFGRVDLIFYFFSLELYVTVKESFSLYKAQSNTGGK